MADNTDIRIVAMAKKAGVSAEVMQQTVDDLVRERLLNKPRRGRKSEIKTHMAIMRSIEALRSTPKMSRKNAINRAAAAWGMRVSTVDKIYKDRKYPSKPRFSPLHALMGIEALTDGQLRSTYRRMGLTLEQILESIRQQARK